MFQILSLHSKHQILILLFQVVKEPDFPIYPLYWDILVFLRALEKLSHVDIITTV